jgi:arylsulfatase A-like enzyme
MLHHPLGVSEEFKGTSEWGIYGDAIHEMDYYVGQIVDALERLKISKETIIVYASDNGRQGGRNESQPLRGNKLTTYECGIRVPCIAYCPGLIEEGAVISDIAHAMDWYPTLASLAGIKIPDDIILDGRDLSAMLKGEISHVPSFQEQNSLNAEIPLRRKFAPYEEWSETFTREEYINAFFYHGSHGALSAVRSGEWKLSLHPDLKLYNLKMDPGEKTPVNNAQIKRKLRGMAVLFQQEMQ